MIANEPVEAAEAAVTSLGASRFREAHRDRVKALVKGRKKTQLTSAFQSAFEATV